VGIKQTQSGWRQHKLLVQFAEYLVGGNVWFWGGMAIFAICFDGLHWPWWISKGLGDIFGWSANYAIQRYWAFYTSRLKGHDRQVITKYVIVNGIDFFIDYAIIWAFVHNQITPYAGFFASAIFTTVWDYLWYRFWVFKPATR